jgi:hypothetical protein
VESVEWCLVLDMTFLSLSASQKQVLNTTLEKIVPFLNPVMLKNLNHLFVVHATNFKTSLFDVLKNIFKIMLPNVPSKGMFVFIQIVT